MRSVWDEPKRLSNIAKHGLDFADLGFEFFLMAKIEAAREDRILAIGTFADQSVIAVVFRRLDRKRFP